MAERDRLFRKYGSPKKNGNPGEVEVTGGNAEKFFSEQNKFLDTEVDIDIKPIAFTKIEELKKAGQVINTQMLAGLNPIIIIE
jgi:hypothetical protein